MKAGGITAASPGSNSRATRIYYPADKRIPRRCFQLRNNNYTLGRNKLQSKRCSLAWSFVIVTFAMKEKGGRVLRNPAETKKKKKVRGKMKLKTSPKLGAKQI